MSAEMPGSAIFSSSRFISLMAMFPSLSILSSSGFPVEATFSFFGAASFFSSPMGLAEAVMALTAKNTPRERRARTA